VNRTYFWLLVGILVLGAALGLLSRLPHREEAPAATAPPPPRVEVALEIDAASRLAPEWSVVPLGADVTLHVRNRSAKARLLALAGYPVSVGIPAGSDAAVEFRADRPGDDFAWLLDGTPAAKLAVSGSHLVEGHR
jgi:hypothetical protein